MLAVDYLGALAASLLFPLLLVPHLGLVRTGFLFGLLNVAVAAGRAARLSRPGPRRRALRMLGAGQRRAAGGRVWSPPAAPPRCWRTCSTTTR